MPATQARLLMPGHPLAGAGVVVTRPGAGAAPLRQAIRRLGGVPVGLPGLTLRPVVDAAAAIRQLRGARAADLIIFTSPAAVRFAWQLQPQLRFGRATQVAAPGAGTARALRRRGVDSPLFPTEREDSEGVLALAPLQTLRGRNVVLLGAAGGRDLLARELAARGARVRFIEVYRRTAPRLTQRHFAALERAPAPLLTLLSSAEALRHLHAALPLPLFERIAAGDCIVSSRRIGARAQALGCGRVHVARSAAPRALLDAAAAAVARHRI